MAQGCKIVAEVIVTAGQGLPVGYASMRLGHANAVMCFYAPQTCAALPATLAAGGAIDAWARFVQHSDAFAELNKLAIEKGCRLVLSPIDESRQTWRLIVVEVDNAERSAREISHQAQQAIARGQANSRKWLHFLNTREGIAWLMRQLGGR